MTNDDRSTLRYNQVQQKSAHNAFQRSEGIADQFLYWRLRSMEVDVHHRDPLDNPVAEGDWSVHHHWFDPISSVATLSQFLQTIAGLHRLNPDHEVITLFIDIKDPFPAAAEAHGAIEFDALLKAGLGPSMIYSPKDFLRDSGATSLRGAVERAQWPTLVELRGKVLVVLTGSATQLENYASSAADALHRSAFLSSPVDEPDHVPGPGDQIFFNINGKNNCALIDQVYFDDFVSRAYYLDEEELWNEAASSACHHLATDKVNDDVDRWASTRSDGGYPFRAIHQGDLETAASRVRRSGCGRTTATGGTSSTASTLCTRTVPTLTRRTAMPS